MREDCFKAPHPNLLPEGEGSILEYSSHMQKNKRISRFFIDEVLVPGQSITLPKHLVNYIVNVLRLKTGNTIILFSGIKDTVQTHIPGEFSATLTDVTRRSASASIDKFIEKDIESPLQAHLFQGISRSERMDFTIQKAVELGIRSITPVFTQRSNAGKLNDKQLAKKSQHWQTIANNACEQSGRTVLVDINPAIEVQQMNNYGAELNLLLAPDADSSLSSLKHLNPASINIFIGPEGGLTDDEISWACQHKYQKISLGPRILRTETAGLATLSVLQFLWGDF